METVARPKGPRPRGTKTTFECPHCEKEITLVGTREAVELLGTHGSTFASWRERDDFPESRWDAGQGALWLRDDLLAWHEQHSKARAKTLAGKLVKDVEGLDPHTAAETLRALTAALEARLGERQKT